MAATLPWVCVWRVESIYGVSCDVRNMELHSINILPRILICKHVLVSNIYLVFYSSYSKRSSFTLSFEILDKNESSALYNLMISESFNTKHDMCSTLNLLLRVGPTSNKKGEKKKIHLKSDFPFPVVSIQ